MEKLIFDTGMKEYQINESGVLRFNPTDPNVYERFYSAFGAVEKIEAELTEQGKALADGDGAGTIRIMTDADKKVKALLADIFGAQNDFGKIFDGVNIMAVGRNGERILTNFLAAMMPIMQAGAEQCMKAGADAAAEEANKRRAARQAHDAQ